MEYCNDGDSIVEYCNDGDSTARDSTRQRNTVVGYLQAPDSTSGHING